MYPQAAKEVIAQLKNAELLKIHKQMGPCYDFNVPEQICDPLGIQQTFFTHAHSSTPPPVHTHSNKNTRTYTCIHAHARAHTRTP